MHKRLKQWLTTAAVFLIVGVTATACIGDSTPSQVNTDQTAVAQRSGVYKTALEQYPAPVVDTFPLRAALVEFTKREALLNHPWYIYLVSDYGTVYQYYVSKTAPINACDFLSSTQNIVYDEHGNLITSAPSLDGIYYGGSGGASSCTTMFFFDAATNALMEYDVHAIVSDVPLTIYKDVPFGGPSGVAPTPAATTTP